MLRLRRNRLCACENVRIVLLFSHSHILTRTTDTMPPTSRATFKMPLLARNCSWLRLSPGRPSVFPYSTARLRPAWTRWRIMLRSNSEKAPQI